MRGIVGWGLTWMFMDRHGWGLFWTYSPSAPSVRHWDRLFDSSPIKRERGYGCFVLLSALPPPLWIADQVRNDVTMRCIVFTLTLVLSHQGRGDMVGVVLFTRVTRCPSGLRIKSAMTGSSCPTVWIPACAGMTDPASAPTNQFC